MKRPPPTSPPTEKPISSAPLPDRVVAARRALDTEGRFLNSVLLKLRTKANSHCYVALDLLDLVNGKTDELGIVVLQYGLLDPVNSPALKHLATAIIAVADKTAVLLRGDGYHRVRVGDQAYECLVWRSTLHWLGPRPKKAVVALPTHPSPATASCSLRTWGKKMGVHFEGNHYLIVMLGAALSPLLARLLRLPQLTLFVVGESSVGKSASQSAVQSIIQPGQPVVSASGTPLGIQQYLSGFADRPVFMQELRQTTDMTALVKLIFDLGNEAGRVIGTTDQQALQAAALHCQLIATNEKTLQEMMQGRSAGADAGLAARMFEMILDAPYGAFHRLPEGVGAAAFAEQLERASGRHYGAVWDAWVEAVVAHEGQIKQWQQDYFERIRARLIEQGNVQDPISRRMVKGLAGWQFAAMVASKLGVINLSADSIKAAFEVVLKEHQARQHYGGTPVGEKVISLIRATVDRNAQKFPPLESAREGPENGIFGYSRDYAGQKYLLFLPDVFQRIVAEFGYRMAARCLRKAGFLRSDAESGQLQVHIPGAGQRKRFYAVSAAISFDGD